MFKRLLYGIVAMTALFHANARAQSSLDLGCHQSYQDYISKAVDSPRYGATAHILAPASFLPSSKDTCGKFILYYEDLEVAATTGIKAGFAEPAGIGLTRRQTLCAVMSYIQSRLDFGKIPANKYINIHVDTSFGAIFHYPYGSSWAGTLGTGVPFYSSTAKAGDTVNGFVWEYITKGTDPNPSDYHGELRFNFDSTVGNEPKHLMGYKSGGEVEIRPWNNGIGSPTKCEWDLYSVAEHSMGHILGWFSWREKYHGLSFAPYFTNLDLSLQLGVDPHGIYNPLAPSLLTPLSTLSSLPPFPRIWVNNRPVPHNSPIDPESLSHLNQVGPSYIYGTRISPGDFRQYVMQYSFSQGHMKRELSKIELETFHDIIGYNYNTTYASDSAAIISNHTPWSSKMSYRYNSNFDSASFAEKVAADFSITNNIATTLTINLNADTTLKDADGDSLSVYPGSLVNFRGAGVGGNNHNSISISPNGRSITYTPRPNFYGRCQFGFNLYDNHEKGAFVLYTIDVQKGTNVSVSTGANLVQNGDVEEGTEVKIRDIADNVNNTAMYFGDFLPGRFGWGGHFADGQYYPNGTAIRHSNVECNEGFSSPYSYGYFTQSYPFSYGAVSHGLNSAYYPEAKDSIGTRYETKRGAGLYYLNDSVKKCKHYILECDVFRTYLVRDGKSTVYSDSEWVSIGFTSNQYLKLPDSTHLIQKNSPYLKRGIPVGAWTHLKIPVSYCNDTPSTVLYLKFSDEGDNNLFSSLLMDNLSLKETDSFFVKIADSSIGTCQRRLYCAAYDLGCNPSYQWRKLGSPTVLSTTSSLDVSNFTVDKYVLTLFDGCGRSATDTFETKGCRCSPSSVFGVKTFDSLKTATLPASLGAGTYYIASDLTVNSNTIFNGARVLIEPNVQITVANNVKFTLDNCHLLTCPDTNKLWKGISLASTGSAAGGTSAKIEVKNNTMIEDAYTAIDANYIKAPASGDIISVTNSIFNRNGTDININNGYALGAAGKYPITLTGNLFTARLFDSTNMTGYPYTWATTNSLKALTTPDDATPNYFVSKKYPKAYRKDSIFSYLCVQVQNVGTTFGGGSSFGEVEIGGGSAVGDLNLYDNHRYGIHSNNTNATVYNSAFIHISKRMYPSALPASTTLPDWGGGGIVARTSNPTLINRVNIVQTLGGNLGNRFFDCWGAIYVERLAYLTVSDAEITSSHRLGLPTPGAAYPSEIYRGTGIELRDSAALVKWTINSNSISNVNAGIYAYLQNPKAGAVTNIKFNQFYAANPKATFAPYTTDQYQLQGIEVYSPTAAAINNLYVDSNSLNNVFNGIYCNGLQFTKASVQYNTINLWDRTMSSPSSQFGIKMESCKDALVSSNTISTPTLGAVLYADRMNGVYAAFNTSLSVCNNSTNKIGRGFSFDQKTAQIGTRWILNNMNDGHKGFVLGSDIGDQGFMYNWATMSPLTFYGATRNQFNIVGGGKYHTTAESGIDTRLSKLYIKSGLPNENPFPNLGVPNIYPNRYENFGSTGSILFPTVTHLGDANCIGSIMPTKTKYIPLGGIKKSLAFLILSDSTGYGTDYRPNQWMAQMALYELCVLDPEMRDSISTLDSFMVAAANSRFAWLTNIETALANGNNSQAQALLNNPVQAMGRVVISPDVIITDYTEANSVVNHYKDYYAVYLKHLTNSMNATDTATIAALAAKCPAKDGAAVYKARGLYRSLTGIVGAYNDDGCLYGNGGQYRLAPLSNEANVSDYVLYPNPNNGSFVITSTSLRGTKQSEAIPVKVYNALGMLVYQKNLSFTNGELSVNLGQASHGVYLVCIENGRDKPTCLRFIIQ